MIVSSLATSEIVEVKDGILLRPKDRPQSWPLPATDLNPEVEEFVPIKNGDEIVDTSGTDGDDESEEEEKKTPKKVEIAEKAKDSMSPVLVVPPTNTDLRKQLPGLLETTETAKVKNSE